MSRCIILPALVLIAAVAGCQNDGRQAAEPSFADQTMPGGNRDNPETSSPPVLFVRLNTWILEAPVGLISRSEDLWSYLEEEQIGPRRQAALGRNGLRVGTAPADAWPEIAERLREMTGNELRRAQTTALPGRSMDLILRREQPAATIFTSQDDRTLVGADYPAGDYVLMVTATLDVHDPSFVLITGMPQIRTGQEQPRYIVTEDGVQLAAEADRYSFDQLMFQLSISDNDIIVIGPGSQSRQTTSIGRHFLVRQTGGMAFEQVVVIRPEITAARR